MLEMLYKRFSINNIGYFSEGRTHREKMNETQPRSQIALRDLALKYDHSTVSGLCCVTRNSVTDHQFLGTFNYTVSVYLTFPTIFT